MSCLRSPHFINLMGEETNLPTYNLLFPGVSFLSVSRYSILQSYWNIKGGGQRLIHASGMNEERLVVPKSHFPHGWASWVPQQDENTLTGWSNRWLDSSCAHCLVPTSISLRVPASYLPDWVAYSLVWRDSAVDRTPPRLWRTTPRVCTPFCHLSSAPPYYLCIPGDPT